MSLTLIALLSLAPQAAPPPPRELLDYVRNRDRSYAFTMQSSATGRTDIQLQSQTWQGVPWKHTLILQETDRPIHRGTAILFITGDGPFERDMRELNLMSAVARLPVALLFDVPNQPIFDMREDDLIAHTLERYLETGDASWPLLFPMTKSAVRAMDAIQQATRGSANPIRQFVVIGASKRGWTTWLVGALNDRRVIGIAPMVIDNLNMERQMLHQMETWGTYSEMIQDYTRRGLQQQFVNERGQHLARMIDPFHYRRNIRVPTLIVNGANDRYWQVDALSKYWDDLRQPKWNLTVPNAGHNLGTGFQAAETISAFAQMLAADAPMPEQEWDFELLEGGQFVRPTVRYRGTSKFPPFRNVKAWVASSDSLDFRESVWREVAQAPATVLRDESSAEVTFPVPRGKHVAVFVEMRYNVDGRQFSLTTPVRVFRNGESSAGDASGARPSRR
jgi:PhoPQ-activated pathogenicity-related protein